MKVIKFSMNEKYYDQFKTLCLEENITIKRKLNFLLAKDPHPQAIEMYFPNDHTENMKPVTLKVNEELYKGVMKKCGQLDFKPSKYMPYLIYKHLKTKVL